MRLIQQLFILQAIWIHGSFLQNLSSLYNCLLNCSQDTCADVCNDIPNGSVDAQVDEDTDANVYLHCIGENMITIKFNPGIYIIEQSLSDSKWGLATATKGSMMTFMNLTPGTRYRYRLYNFTTDGLSRSEVSDWFSTYEADYEPLPVKNITLLRQMVDERNKYSLRADFAFEPGEDLSCNYKVLVWSGEHNMWDFNIEQLAEFRFQVKALDFDRKNNVSIAPINNHDDVVGPKRFTTFYTGTCLEYYNLSVCAPDDIKGLRAEHTYRGKNLYDLKICWAKPLHEPDNYTIEIDLRGDEETLYNKVIPGNITSVLIPNVELGSQYKVSMVADSSGGTSSAQTIKNIVTNHAKVISNSHRELIIGITLLVMIVMIVGMSLRQYCSQKSPKFTTECADIKNSYLDISASLYTMPDDKYELQSNLLTIKDLIGSGAYGVVRLGSLRDEFDNIKDVAVKMLKDKPSTEDIRNFHKEILITKFVGQHPNVVSLIGYCNLFNKPVLVVEYCSKGDLQTYLRRIWQSMVNVSFKERTRFQCHVDRFSSNGAQSFSSNTDEKRQSLQSMNIFENRLYDIEQNMSEFTEFITANDLLNFAIQIATGMEFLASNRIVHRDLAARNILVGADRIAKISDFGLSRDIYQENLYRKRSNGKLPLKWTAIEALTHQIYTTQSDVWSFGILLWEIVTIGATPYHGIPAEALLKLLKSGYRLERPTYCSIELYNIMLQCWNVRPRTRQTFTQLKESLRKLLTYQTVDNYLNINEIFCEPPEKYHELEK